MVSLSGDPIVTGKGFSRPRKHKLDSNSAMNPLCKLCLLPVAHGEERVWLRKPMGVSHKVCADGRTDIVRT